VDGSARPGPRFACETQGAFEQLELFLADISGAPSKGDRATLEFPFFSLCKRPGNSVRRYDFAGVCIEIIPSARGAPTIYDADVLYYCAGQLTEAANRGRTLGRTLHVRTYDLLKSTQRGLGGGPMQRLIQALDRLTGARIKTNIRTDGLQAIESFGLVDGYRLLDRTSVHDPRLSITLSDWLFRSVQAREVLTLHPAYFGLTSGLERRLYLILRKHVGNQPAWSIRLENLHRKSGSESSLRRFRFEICRLVARNLQPPLDRFILHIQGDYFRAYSRDSRGKSALLADLKCSRKATTSGDSGMARQCGDIL